tara:strand:- start:28337 stop:29386 length:1050 start_codon:yes stop_codon:yes gene_type:complete
MGIIKLPKKSIENFSLEYKKIFETGSLAEGDWNKSLSKLVAEISNAKGCVTVASNGTGLMCLLQIYKENHNRKNILIQSNTMYGMYTMSMSSGYIVEGYIECSLNTLMPSLQQIKTSVENIKCKKDELVILLSHMGGIINPEVEEIAKYCKFNKIILLEDCAHSFGATYNNKHSGLFGDAGVYSFYSTKAIPAGEGGAIVSNDEELISFADRYTKYDRFERKFQIGNNIRLSELQALLIFCVVKEYKEIINNKKVIANLYKETCLSLNINFIDQNSNNHIGNHYKFVIYCDDLMIKDFLPKLVTKTSEIYDYSLCGSDFIPKHHICLPIWYNQERKITDSVIHELHDNY